MNQLKRVKVITGYSADARWWAEVDEKPIGEIPSEGTPRSPYAFGPTHVVWNWNGRRVISVETKHRRYEVFDIGDIPILPLETEE